MTLEAFRRLVLSMPNAEERSHMRHPDFRVGGKIFATACYPDERWAMVKLPAAQARKIIRSDPETFRPAAGAWGRGGSTLVLLSNAKASILKPAVVEAWRNAQSRAPQRSKRTGS
jgi:hypothetical protein